MLRIPRVKGAPSNQSKKKKLGMVNQKCSNVIIIMVLQRRPPSSPENATFISVVSPSAITILTNSDVKLVVSSKFIVFSLEFGYSMLRIPIVKGAPSNWREKMYIP